MLSAMVSVDLPLFRGDRQDREIAAAQAEARGLHEMHDDHQREMQAMLAEAVAVVERTASSRSSTRPTWCRSPTSRCRPRCSPTAAIAPWWTRSSTARRTALETRLKHLRLAADRAQAQYEVDYLVGEGP